MINHVIIKKDKNYDVEESCLSLLGVPHVCMRYKKIKVQYQNLDIKTRIKSYEDWTSEIIQHEIDHCNGTLI